MSDKSDRFKFERSLAVLATMPLLERELGLTIQASAGLNTDCFGTFTREIERAGSQLDAARAKIAAAFQMFPATRIGIASEGSFGPHPHLPFVALGRELVLFYDRTTRLELSGYDASSDTNFAHRVVSNIDEVIAFADQIDFPKHGLVIIASKRGEPDTARYVIKDALTHSALEAAVQKVLADSGQAFIETDMRADRNPTRMAAIARATADLVRRCRSRCPDCAYPGFDITERLVELPCEWCGEPTRLIHTLVLACNACGHRIDKPASDRVTADTGQSALRATMIGHLR